MSKVIIVRHGQSIANLNDKHQGAGDEWSDTPLSKEGLEQARLVAKRLENEDVSKIYSSTLKRASMTAQEIAKLHNVQVIEDPRIIDSFGGSELQEIIERCKDFLKDTPPEENIIIVAHGETNLILMSLLLKMNHEETLDFITHASQRNSCVNILENNGDCFIIKLLNDVSHAEGKIMTSGRW